MGSSAVKVPAIGEAVDDSFFNESPNTTVPIGGVVEDSFFDAPPTLGATPPNLDGNNAAMMGGNIVPIGGVVDDSYFGQPSAPASRTAVDLNPVTLQPPNSGFEPEFQQAIGRVAQNIGVTPEDLTAVMQFETGGKFASAERNKASGATGLIQFMPSTARDLGTTVEDLAKMPRAQQMSYVEKYLAPYAGKLKDRKDLYLAILNPQSIGQPDEAVMQSGKTEWRKGTPFYDQNSGFDADKKGYITVGDVTRRISQEQPGVLTRILNAVGKAGLPAQPGPDAAPAIQEWANTEQVGPNGRTIATGDPNQNAFDQALETTPYVRQGYRVLANMGDTVGSLANRGMAILHSGIDEPYLAKQDTQAADEHVRAIQRREERMSETSHPVTNFVSNVGTGVAKIAAAAPAGPEAVVYSFIADAANTAWTRGKDAGLSDAQNAAQATAQGALAGLAGTPLAKASEMLWKPLETSISAAVKRAIEESGRALLPGEAAALGGRVVDKLSTVNPAEITPEEISHIANETIASTFATVGALHAAPHLTNMASRIAAGRPDDGVGLNDPSRAPEQTPQPEPSPAEEAPAKAQETPAEPPVPAPGSEEALQAIIDALTPTQRAEEAKPATPPAVESSAPIALPQESAPVSVGRQRRRNILARLTPEELDALRAKYTEQAKSDDPKVSESAVLALEDMNALPKPQPATGEEVTSRAQEEEKAPPLNQPVTAQGVDPQVSAPAPEPAQTPQSYDTHKSSGVNINDPNVLPAENTPKPSSENQELQGQSTPGRIDVRGEFPSRVEEVPVSRLNLSPDVPQFKENADDSGVVEGNQLQGKYQRDPMRPIVAWERLNGDLEVITGRHRFDLARRSGEETIPTQIYREADGFTANHALTMDAESNIQDEQGTVRDYAHYFKNKGIDEAEAKAKGFLSRAKGKAGWALAKSASNDLYDAFRNNVLSEDRAVAIAMAAPGNEQAQRVGIRAAADNPSASAMELANTVRSVLAFGDIEGGHQTDLFGGIDDEPYLREMARRGKIATDYQRQIAEQIRILNAAKIDPAKAQALGIDIKVADRGSVEQEKARLKVEQERWRTWYQHPDLVAKVKGEETAQGVQEEINATPEDTGQPQDELFNAGEPSLNEPAPAAPTQPKPQRGAPRERVYELDSTVEQAPMLVDGWRKIIYGEKRGPSVVNEESAQPVTVEEALRYTHDPEILQAARDAQARGEATLPDTFAKHAWYDAADRSVHVTPTATGAEVLEEFLHGILEHPGTLSPGELRALRMGVRDREGRTWAQLDEAGRRGFTENVIQKGIEHYRANGDRKGLLGHALWKVGQMVKSLGERLGIRSLTPKDVFDRLFHGYNRSRRSMADPVEGPDGTRAAVGDRLRDVEVPADDEKPVLIDTRKSDSEMILEAGKAVASWPREIIAADGARVLLHNSERGRMAERVKHMASDESRTRVAPDKAAWIPNVPKTIEGASYRLGDSENGTKVYVRKYANGDTHFVVVRPDGVVTDQEKWNGRLITQFPHGSRRQNELRIEWERAKSPSSVSGSGGAARTGSLDRNPNQARHATDLPFNSAKDTLPPKDENVKPDRRASVRKETADDQSEGDKSRMELPELTQLARDLMNGKYPGVMRRIRAKGVDALGVFSAMGDGRIGLRADLFLGKRLEQQEYRGRPSSAAVEELRQQTIEKLGLQDQEKDVVAKVEKGVRGRWTAKVYLRDHDLVAKTLAHEIGHLVDYLPDGDLKRGNLLGRLASLKKYMLGTLPDSPNNPEKAISEEEIARWKEEASKPEESWETITKIIEEAIPGSGAKVTAQDIKDIWKKMEGTSVPGLADYIKKLPDPERKRVAKEAMKGIVSDLLKSFQPSAGTRKVEITERQRVVKEPSKAEITRRLMTKIREEIERRKLVEDAVVRKEMQDLSKWWKPIPPDAPQSFIQYRMSGPELYADWISTLFNNPAEAEKRAPVTFRTFFNYLDAKPKVRALYDSIQREIDAGNVPSNRLESYRGMLGRGEDRQRQAFEKRTAKERVSVSALLSKLKQELVSEAEVLPENSREAAKRLEYMPSTVVQMLRDLDRDVLGPLKQAGISTTDMGAFLGLRRAATERADLANPLGQRGAHAEGTLDELRRQLGDEKYQTLERAAKSFWDLRNKFIIPRLKQSRMLSEELMKKVEDNENYAKFTVQDFITEFLDGNGGSWVFPQKGTLKEIANPFTETLKKDISLLRAVYANEAKWSAIQNTGAVAAPKKRVRGVERFMEPTDRRLAMMTVQRDGERQAWHVPREVAKFFEEDPERFGVVFRALSVMTKPFKQLFVTNNPMFGLWNLQRDARSLYQHLPGNPVTQPLSVVKAYAQTARDAWMDAFLDKSTPFAEQLYRADTLIAGRSYSAQEHLGSADDLDRLMARYEVGGREDRMFWSQLGKWVFNDFNQFMERWSKFASAKYLLNKGGSLEDPKVREMIRSRGGSPDFLERGTMTPLLNQVFMFSNANIQGTRASVNALRENPVQYTIKLGLQSILPKVLMFAAGKGLFDWFFGLDDEPIKKTMERIPEQDRRNYITVPLGLTEDGEAQYMVFPQDFTGQVAGRIATVAMENGADWQGIGGAVAGMSPYGLSQLAPPLELAMDLMQVVAGQNPYDFFRGDNKVSDTAWKAGGPDMWQELAQAQWNDVFGSNIAKLDSQGGDSPLAQAGRLPVLGPALRRFVRVSGRGEDDALRHVTEDASAEQARMSLRVGRFIGDEIERYDRAATPSDAVLKKDAEAAYNRARAQGDVFDSGYKKSAFVQRYINAAVFRSGDAKRKALQRAGRMEKEAIQAAQ